MSLSLKRIPQPRFWVFTLALCALPLLAARWRRPAPEIPAKPYHFPTRELAELDRTIQARFAVIPDSDFGVGRVGPRHGYFSPQIPQEKQVIADLQKAKQDVVFYVVGRNTILRQMNYLWFSPVQGPVYITPHKPTQSVPNIGEYGYSVRFYSPNGIPKDSPNDQQLFQLGKSVFEDETLREGTNNKINSWSVVARPVLATSEACVSCHNARPPWKTSEKRRFALSWNAKHDIVSLGDTLGIALYCYRPARKTELKKLSDAEAQKLPFAAKYDP